MTDHIASHTFRHSGHPVRVTMTDPNLRADGGEVNLSHGFIATKPPAGFTEPTWTFGIYCPARFIAEGLPYPVEFQIDIHPHDDTSRVGIVDIRIGGPHPNIERAPVRIDREDLARIPVDRLLAAAIHAAGIVVMHYPPNYHGPEMVYAPHISPKPVAIFGMIRRGEPRVESIPAAIRGLPVDADFHKAVADVPDVPGDDRLRMVADIVKDAHNAGRPATKDVQQLVNVSERTARRLIAEARTAGHLPMLPETDKRTTRQRKKK